MTTDRLELLLAIGIVVVYLLDAMRFLGHREALVERLAADRWRLLFGTIRLELLGHRPALPNPLRPDRVSCVARWRPAADTGPDAPGIQWPPTGRARAPLGWLCLALLVTVVLIAPVLLVAGWSNAFAAAVAAGYLFALAAARLLVLRAAEFGLRRGQALGMAAIGVLCLPCAPNLLRAAVGGRKLAVELPGFGEASAGHAERQGFRRRFARVLRQELLQGSGDPRQDAELREMLRRTEELT